MLCIAMIAFLLFTPKFLVTHAKDSFVDARFVRTSDRYNGTIVLYHVVTERPYTGSLTAWLTTRAETYEKKHKGTYFLIEGMDEKEFLERIESGRIPDAYSFFTGSVWEDRLCALPDLHLPLRDGIVQAERAIPYGYSGFVKISKSADSNEKSIFTNHPVLAARLGIETLVESEDKADTLYVDLRRAGDLIRYHEEYMSAEISPIDDVSEAVCWLGIDRNCDPNKCEVILDFCNDLLSVDEQIKLNELGMLSVRNDVADVPPDVSLKKVFKTYRTVKTFDPFLWQREYDALLSDALLALNGDTDARKRFTIRLQELYS